VIERVDHGDSYSSMLFKFLSTFAFSHEDLVASHSAGSTSCKYATAANSMAQKAFFFPLRWNGIWMETFV